MEWGPWEEGGEDGCSLYSGQEVGVRGQTPSPTPQFQINPSFRSGFLPGAVSGTSGWLEQQLCAAGPCRQIPTHLEL